MSNSRSDQLSKLKKIYPNVEIVDPAEMTKLENRHRGKLYWILLPDMLLERTGGGTMGQYAFPNVALQRCSGREFGDPDEEGMWIKFIYSMALQKSQIMPHTPVRVKKHLYNPTTRSYQIVVQRYTAKSFRDTLLNIADRHPPTKRDLRWLVKSENPWA